MTVLPHDILGGLQCGCTFYADASQPKPMDFTIHSVDMEPIPLRSVSSPILYCVLVDDINAAKQAPHPYYHSIEQMIADHLMRYTRPLLPVLGEDGEVCCIYVFSCRVADCRRERRC